MIKRLLCLLSVLLLLLTGCSQAARGPMQQVFVDEDAEGFYKDSVIGGNTVSVVSYNVRCCDDPNGNSIKERAPRLEKAIKKYDPDLIGMQEFVPAWDPYTKKIFSDDYDYIINYRCKDNYEGTPIFWKRAKFKLLDHGVFWLSETPDQESLGWDADYYRICAWVKLQVRATGKVFYYYNTHFDYTEPPQEPSALLMAERVVTDTPAIVTGDFNMEPDSKGYAAMVKTFTDANTQNDATATFTSYGDPETNKRLDYVFVRNAATQNYKVMTEMPGGNYVSDHFGVYSEVILT